MASWHPPAKELTSRQSLTILGGWLGLMIFSFNKQKRKDEREKAMSLENPQTAKQDSDKLLDRSEILKRKHATHLVDHPLVAWFIGAQLKGLLRGFRRSVWPSGCFGDPGEKNKAPWARVFNF
jgi:hypothetical protein